MRNGMFNDFRRTSTGLHTVFCHQLDLEVAHQACFLSCAPNLLTSLETPFHPANKQRMEADNEPSSPNLKIAATGVPAAVAAPTGCSPGASANILHCTTTDTARTVNVQQVAFRSCNQCLYDSS
jgi:hypothetical protein